MKKLTEGITRLTNYSFADKIIQQFTPQGSVEGL